MANENKKKPLITIETNSRDYITAIARFLIEIAVLAVPFAFIFFSIPAENPLRWLIVIPLALMFFSLILFFGRCLTIADNRKKDRISTFRYEEKFRPVHVQKEDFVYLLKHSDLSETLVLKSKEGKHALFELSIFENIREFFFEGKEYKNIDSLTEAMKEKCYLGNSITVCETTEHNKPRLIFDIIDSVMEKEGSPRYYTEK